MEGRDAPLGIQKVSETTKSAHLTGSRTAMAGLRASRGPLRANDLGEGKCSNSANFTSEPLHPFWPVIVSATVPGTLISPHSGPVNFIPCEHLENFSTSGSDGLSIDWQEIAFLPRRFIEVAEVGQV